MSSSYHQFLRRRELSTLDVRSGSFSLMNEARQQFGSWTELEHFLEKDLCLESVAISLQKDFVNASAAGDLGSMGICHIDDASMLVEVTVGYQARLVTHLSRSTSGETVTDWPSKSFHRFITRSALDIYAATVSSRVVDLSANARSDRVASLYLDGAGKVQSATSDSRSLCRLICGDAGCDDRMFSSSVAAFLQDLATQFGPGVPRSGEGGGIVFALACEKRFVHCMMRRLHGDGFLLSICLDEEI